MLAQGIHPEQVGAESLGGARQDKEVEGEEGRRKDGLKLDLPPLADPTRNGTDTTWVLICCRIVLYL